MRISKLSTAAFVILCAGWICVRADDNVAQAAARAALMEKMTELDNAAATNAAPKTQTSTTPDTGAMADTNRTAPVNVVTGVDLTATNSTPPDVVKGAPIFSTTPSNYNQAAQAALSQADTNIVVVHKSAAPQISTAKKSVPAKSSDASAVSAKNWGWQPIQAPPSPVTAEQQAQLQALLQRYEADKISPDEYQAERARIINGQ